VHEILLFNDEWNFLVITSGNSINFDDKIFSLWRHAIKFRSSITPFFDATFVTQIPKPNLLFVGLALKLKQGTGIFTVTANQLVRNPSGALREQL
jgi:hypothetical protein